METSGKKRLYLGLAILGMVILCFISGFFLGKARPSGRSSIIYPNEMNEVIDYLDKYYYKDYDKEEFKKAYLKGGVSSLNDPYTYIYFIDYDKTTTPSFGYGIGVSESALGYRITSVLKNSPAEKAGIKVNDYFIGVDDLTLEKNSYNELDNYLSTIKNEEVTMYLLRNYRKYSVKIKKDTLTPESLVETKLIGNIGYLSIKEFESGVSVSVKEKLSDLESKNISGLIIDVRNNPGGLSSEVVAILRLFLTGDDAFLYMESKDSATPEIFRPNAANTKKPYDIKVLINKNSASASEVFALAMNRVMGYDLIGNTTFGKGIFQSDIPLTTMNNAYLHVTRGYWYGKDKENIHKKGIDPTIVVDDDIYVPFVISNETYTLDMANDDIKNIEIMLNVLGYETRVDGYFDSNLENLLETNYEKNVIDYEVSKKIYDEYNNYISNISNDKVVNKAISLFE